MHVLLRTVPAITQQLDDKLDVTKVAVDPDQPISGPAEDDLGFRVRESGFMNEFKKPSLEPTVSTA